MTLAWEEGGRRLSSPSQLDLAFWAAAVIGTSTKPRLSAVFIHRVRRSIETGSALATPTATPPSRDAARRAAAP